MRRQILHQTSARALWAVTAWGVLWGPRAHAQVPQGWDTQTCRTLVYDIRVDMYHDGTDFRELDHRKLIVTIGKGRVEIARTSTIEGSNQKFGPFAFGADGSMTPIAENTPPPPLEAEMLLHVLPAPPPVPTLTQWDVTDPPDARLEVTKVALQQRTHYQVTADRTVNGQTIRDINLDSYLRLIENLAVTMLIGPPGQRPPEIQQILDRLSQFGLFMFGTCSWNVDERMTTACELTYVAVPHSGGTRASISASKWRQHLVATLTEVRP